MLINKLTIEGEPIMRNSYNYKKIWIKHNGEIPKDENGLSYEIHHINGDPTDDRIENLICVSIKEHFDIHNENGDYKACELIAGRMNNPSLGRKMSEKYKKGGILKDCIDNDEDFYIDDNELYFVSDFTGKSTSNRDSVLVVSMQKKCILIDIRNLTSFNRIYLNSKNKNR
jgi:hypothetical protein